MEECLAEVEVLEHFYTTDFFIKSAFNESQIISVYYLVRAVKPLMLSFKEKAFDFDEEGHLLQSFRWIPLSSLSEEHVTFPTDKKVVELLKLTF
jgi:8-oxo-dGTP diphosphatase